MSRMLQPMTQHYINLVLFVITMTCELSVLQVQTFTAGVRWKAGTVHTQAECTMPEE